MVYQKLEEDIRKALEGKEYGPNKIVVKTSYNGGLEIYDFKEEATIEEIEDLQGQIEDLEQDNQTHIDEINRLEKELAKKEEGTEEDES